MDVHDVRETREGIEVSAARYRLGLQRSDLRLVSLCLFDGIEWRELVPKHGGAGDGWDLPVVDWEVRCEGPGQAEIEAVRASGQWRVSSRIELFARGYLVHTFTAEALASGAVLPDLRAGIALSEPIVFSRSFGTRNLTEDTSHITFPRALSLDFATDSRPASCSVDVLVERPLHGTDGRPWRKVLRAGGDQRFLGWEAPGGGRRVERGFRYSNRWAVTWTAYDNAPGPVRGQRIYHWYGRYPRYPGPDLLDEMAEYGCSILALHMPCFDAISGSRPTDPVAMRGVVDRAHALGMKVLFYCQPTLVSIHAPSYAPLASMCTEGRRIWQSMKDTQIVFYEPDESYDADELCLRCDEAYRFIRDTVLACYREYAFDGLYIDWAWPAQGLCSDPGHGHGDGLYGFYDYWRMIRAWREAIGQEALMIGHGGGLLVGSDFVEGFDACLTGEAQARLDPVVLGRQYGRAPTLWTMHRRKQEVFRSARTVDELVREAVTPHVGLGVMGTSILASLDPAHWPEVLVLWQIWRGFPVERSRCFTYLSEPVIELDNSEIVFHLFVTANEPSGQRHALLVLANAGGPYHDRNPAVGVLARLDVGRLGLGAELECRRVGGRRYETLGIRDAGRVRDGFLAVPELLLHEVVGLVLSPGEPPPELERLRRHLEGRSRRMGPILAAAARRAREVDLSLDRFALLPQARNRMSYERFMEGRAAE